ncbi:unnamed protein product [Amoebophrya sp. A120]|nr:unnamed protein product [Amoebophrya sp. A120]|eukprot:GSA120T00017794001.1
MVVREESKDPNVTTKGEVRGESLAEAGSDLEKKASGSTPTTNSKPSSVVEEPTTSTGEEVSGIPKGPAFKWDSDELKKFWEECFSPNYNSLIFDGLHPKALCSKICNDVLRTNINVNSASSNPNDRLLCFEVLSNLEAKFIELGIVQKPTPKMTGNPNHQQYQRVSHQDWNRFAGHLAAKNQSLEAWARECVEESIRLLSAPKRNGMARA